MPTKPHAAGADLVRLRQQAEKQVIDGVLRPSAAWPTSSPPRACANDYVGAFAVTAGSGRRQEGAVLPGRPRRLLAIMLKALADRLAEALAEACTSACARTCGAMPPTKPCRKSADRREVPRHPPGARLPGLPGPQASSATCSSCCSPQEIGMGLTELDGDVAGGQRERLLPEPPRQHLLQRRQDRRRTSCRTRRRAAVRTSNNCNACLQPI
jgi:cobalamin-dependent methionine synthase I